MELKRNVNKFIEIFIKEKIPEKYSLKKSGIDELIGFYIKDSKNIWYRFIFRQYKPISWNNNGNKSDTRSKATVIAY